MVHELRVEGLLVRGRDARQLLLRGGEHADLELGQADAGPRGTLRAGQKSEQKLFKRVVAISLINCADRCLSPLALAGHERRMPSTLKSTLR